MVEVGVCWGGSPIPVPWVVSGYYLRIVLPIVGDPILHCARTSHELPSPSSNLSHKIWVPPKRPSLTFQSVSPGVLTVSVPMFGLTRMRIQVESQHGAWRYQAMTFHRFQRTWDDSDMSSSNKKLLGTSASLLVTSACNKKLVETISF